MQRGLTREKAAVYVGLKESKFDRYVRARLLPKPLPFGVPYVWDRQALDEAMDRLSGLVKTRSVTANDEVLVALENAALEALNVDNGPVRNRKAKP